MTFFYDILILTVGFVFLIKGADFLVDNASIFAHKIGFSQMTIGITIVAFGTSLPELLISFLATISGSPDINIGNVIGSNICNISLVFGTTALIAPVIVKFKILLKEMPMVVIISALFCLVIMNGIVTPADGIVLLIAFFIFIYFSISKDDTEMPEGYENIGNVRIFSLILIGLAGVVGGAQLVVNSAVNIAKSYGIAEAVIGATIIALGTSLPELVTSVVAAWKGQSELSLGNVLGSNIFNIAFIPGLISLIKPIQVTSSIIRFDMWVMIFMTIILYPLIIARLRISKAEGIFLLACYFSYNFMLYSTFF